MGLYKLACAALDNGVQEYIDSLFTDFHNAANESRLADFAVFFPIDKGFKKGFKIILNKGFNAETVRKSVSTADFWNGMLQDEAWHFIKGEALNPFFQLFSAYDASFDCLSIKKASHKGKTFIFAAAGEFSDVFLQKQLDSVMPLIERTYTVLYTFYTPLNIFYEKKVFLAEAASRFESKTASLYTLKLNKLFESLFALLGPSDFDFIISCIGSAVIPFAAEAPLCFSADDESSLYILLQEKEGSDFCDGIKNTFKKMFSQKRADFMRAERTCADSALYQELEKAVTLNKNS